MSTSVHYYACIDVPCGGQKFSIEKDEIPKIEADPTEWAAKKVGLSVEQYLRWVESGGAVQCCATTRSGKRCRNYGSAIQLSADTWKRLDDEGVYCYTHSHDTPRAQK